MTYEEIIETLRRIRGPQGLFKRRLPKKDMKALVFVEGVLKEFLEPWMCPDCNHTVKLPEDIANPRHCSQCQGNKMFPYAYLEQERMSRQLGILLKCVQYYSEQKNSEVAETTLRSL